MNEAALSILLTMKDEASSKFVNVNKNIHINRVALQQLATSVTYLGATFLGLGIAMDKMNNPFAQSVGHMFMMVGAIASSVGAAAQFIASIGKMVKALQSLHLMQILTQAFSGPVGWASLGVGVAVAGGAMAGYAAYSKSQARVTNNNVTINNAGNVIAERNLANQVRQSIIGTQERNVTSGIR